MTERVLSWGSHLPEDKLIIQTPNDPSQPLTFTFKPTSLKENIYTPNPVEKKRRKSYECSASVQCLDRENLDERKKVWSDESFGYGNKLTITFRLFRRYPRLRFTLLLNCIRCEVNKKINENTKKHTENKKVESITHRAAIFVTLATVETRRGPWPEQGVVLLSI